MKGRLLLCLTGSQLTLQLRQAAPGIRGLWGASGPVTRHEVPVEQNGLAAALQQAGAALPPLRGARLEAQLGLDFARIGLMTLQHAPATTIDAATREGYVQAWVRQMLHLEPATQVIRTQVLADPRKLLVSCIDRPTLDALTAFAAARGLRFASCRPAVLTAKDAAGTLAWTETSPTGGRSAVVQLLRYQQGQLVATWRGWVPIARADADPDLEAAVRRFQAHTRAAEGEQALLVRWPGSDAATA